jgi:penicillin-binding protein 2
VVNWRRKNLRLVDPRSPRPRLAADPTSSLEDPFLPRSVQQQALDRPVPPRLLLFAGIVLVAFAALVYNLFTLQVSQTSRFAALAEGNRVRKEVVLAPRGIVFDRHGVQLVQNRGSFAVAIVPADIARHSDARKQELQKLQELTGISAVEIQRQADLNKAEPFQPVVLKKNLDAPTYEAISENLPNLPGVRLQTDSTRHYLDGLALSHILGYVGKLDPAEYKALNAKGYLLNDQVGKNGLEFQDENYLRGASGTRVVETDAQGREVRTVSQTDPTPGDNVYLSLDLGLQKEVVKDLQETMTTQHQKLGGDKALGGAAIVMNPQTGEILSLVSLPDYNLNQFADGITVAQYQALIADPRLPMLDRAIGGLYPPGSTFKPVTGSAALQAGTVKAGSTIFCPGFLQRGSTRFGCWQGSGHGNQNIVDAIAHSCDVFFYTVADQMGDTLLNKFAQDFGVGRKTGIDLGGEAKGIAPDRDWKKKYFADAFQSTGDPGWKDSYWYEGNTITYGIGQSYLLVTPLQDLQWTATVANGGHFMKPQVNGHIAAADGSIVRPFQPVTDHNVAVAPQTLAIIREGLRAAASSGGTSGFIWNQKQFANVPSPSGKTGTAQYGVPDASGNYAEHAWYTAYAPAVDPEVAVITFVEGGGEGHESASPAAAKIVSYYFAHRDQIRSTSTPVAGATASAPTDTFLPGG